MTEKIVKNDKVQIVISDRSYVLYRYSSMGGMEIMSRLVASLINPSDWELRNIFIGTLMRNVAVYIEDGTECRMISNEIINKYTDGWEDVVRIIKSSLALNSEHLQDGSLITWIEGFKKSFKGKIPGFLSSLMPVINQAISAFKSKKE